MIFTHLWDVFTADIFIGKKYHLPDCFLGAVLAVARGGGGGGRSSSSSISNEDSGSTFGAAKTESEEKLEKNNIKYSIVQKEGNLKVSWCCVKKCCMGIDAKKLPGGGLGDGAMVRTAAAGRYLAGMSVFLAVGTTGGRTFSPMGF